MSCGFLEGQAYLKKTGIKLCCLHFYVTGNSLIDGAEKKGVYLPYQLQYLQNVQNTNMFSNGHKAANSVFTLVATYFLLF